MSTSARWLSIMDETTRADGPGTFVIVNPQAGNGRAGRRWPDLANRLRHAIGDFDHALTSGSGDAGLVLVDAQELIISDGNITSFTEGTGAAGLVDVNVTNLSMTGGRIDSSSDSTATISFTSRIPLRLYA